VLLVVASASIVGGNANQKCLQCNSHFLGARAASDVDSCCRRQCLHCGGGTDQNIGEGHGFALGHGGGAHAKDLSPRLIEVLVGKKVVGVATGFKSHCVDARQERSSPHGDGIIRNVHMGG
jgi:hypothetical protein